MTGSELRFITEKALARKEAEKKLFFESYLKNNEAYLKKIAEDGQYSTHLDSKTKNFMDRYGVSEYFYGGFKFSRSEVIWGPYEYEDLDEEEENEEENEEDEKKLKDLLREAVSLLEGCMGTLRLDDYGQFVDVEEFLNNPKLEVYKEKK